MKTNKQTVAALKSRLAEVFAGACKTLSIAPLYTSFGARCAASFATKVEASALVEALKSAGAKDIDVHHWDPKVDADFDRDEYQVCWS
jgi:hypothetical protein